MGKMFGILMVMAAVWVGMTVYSQGVDQAYGGLFAGNGGREQVAQSQRRGPVTERVRVKVSGQFQDHESAMNRRLDSAFE